MAQIKLILRQDVEKLGHAGDLVAVKPGYARNYLLRKGMASLATAARVKELEHHRRVIAEQQAKTLADLEGFKRKIESLTLEVEAQAGDGGKLFGSVTLQNVADLLAAKGVEIDRRKLQADGAIKSVGEHELSLRLHREVVAKVKVVVTTSGVAAPPPEEGDQDEAEVEAPTDESEEGEAH
jgi:large subunit ribosomal protein L9